MLVWMNEAALAPGRTYLLQHGPRTTPARVEKLLYRWDVNTLEPRPAAGLELNEIGRVLIEAAEPLAFDSYRDNRSTGGFILIDPIHNLTLGAGLIEKAVRRERRGASGVAFRAARLTPAERQALFGHKGAVVDLSARPDLAPLLERQLLEQGHHALLVEIPGLPAEALAEVGQIVVTTHPVSQPLVASADLSPDDDEALLELHERLRRAGVFAAEEAIEPGEGI